eukprot:scaffold60993_cov31-Tisochrysis_lutea.AAC.1
MPPVNRSGDGGSRPTERADCARCVSLAAGPPVAVLRVPSGGGEMGLRVSAGTGPPSVRLCCTGSAHRLMPAAIFRATPFSLS